ncbi:MAG: hypothetical protein RR748_08590 [Pseudomonas sp.]
MTMVVFPKSDVSSMVFMFCTRQWLKIAKGKKVWRFVVALILADRVDGSQWAMGQKGIDMANLNDHRYAQAKVAGEWLGIVRTRLTHFATIQTPLNIGFSTQKPRLSASLKSPCKEQILVYHQTNKYIIIASQHPRTAQ